MKNKTLILSIIIVLFFGQLLSGQSDFRPGYYITHENDTINGFLGYRGNQQLSMKCAYKSSDSGELVYFNPKDIKAYRFLDGKFFVSRIIKTENTSQTRFLEYLVNGIRSLYYYEDEKMRHYLIEQPGGELVELNILETEIYKDGRHYKHIRKNYVGLLKSSMADCMEIQPAVERSELSHKSLINLVSDYHSYVCNGEECIIYEKQLLKPRIKIAPIISIGISALTLKQQYYIEDITWQHSFMPAMGVQMNIVFPNRNEKFPFQLESILFKNYHHGCGPLYTVSSNYDEYYLHTYFLQNSASFLYTFPGGIIRPKISLGGLSCLLLKNNSHHIREHPINGVDITDSTLPIKKAFWGFLIKVGFDYHLWEDFIFFTDFRYQSCSVINEDLRTGLFDEDIGLRSISMDVGIYF